MSEHPDLPPAPDLGDGTDVGRRPWRRRDAPSRGSRVGQTGQTLPWFEDPAATPTGPSTAVLAEAPREAPEDEDDEDLDLPGRWSGRPRFGRLTVTLAAGIVAVAAFAGGVLIQKRHDAGLTASAGTGAAGRVFGPGGFAVPGTAGSGTAGSGTAGSGSAVPGGAGQGSTAAGRASGEQAPVVVGTVVSAKGTALLVKNFGGALVKVNVPAGTPVTVPGLVAPSPGMSVAVTGTKAADGSVTASGVVARLPG
jgi:preprotein translocase subunit SecG